MKCIKTKRSYNIESVKILSDLPLNKTGIIKDINCIDNVKRRLLDLGLICGTPITPILISPSSDPRAFEVRNSVIAIRKEDAKQIKIITKY